MKPITVCDRLIIDVRFEDVVIDLHDDRATVHGRDPARFFGLTSPVDFGDLLHD